ncbi:MULTISPECIES: hypothetical protein [unclassified Streptomyces]|uniref:hypothetical protein n=1 Tax=unclassified Streptomyces TaxID=2593676 RepID=UPI001CBDE3F1|nr:MULTISPECIES: hypothetical protein [unclassified Streptomyces]WPO69764.1 hypothetical protein R9806_03495 [Streptomyces sp. KN37]
MIAPPAPGQLDYCPYRLPDLHAVVGEQHGPLHEESVRALHALLFRVAHEEPEPAGVPDSLLGRVQQCLEKDPALRPLPQKVAARTVAVTAQDAPWLPPQPEWRPERWRPRGPRAENQ